jgi:hypothetical protein
MAGRLASKRALVLSRFFVKLLVRAALRFLASLKWPFIYFSGTGGDQPLAISILILTPSSGWIFGASPVILSRSGYGQAFGVSTGAGRGG